MCFCSMLYIKASTEVWILAGILTAICVTLTILNPDLPGINACMYVCMNGCMQVVYVNDNYLLWKAQ